VTPEEELEALRRILANLAVTATATPAPIATRAPLPTRAPAAAPNDLAAGLQTLTDVSQALLIVLLAITVIVIAVVAFQTIRARRAQRCQGRTKVPDSAKTDRALALATRAADANDMRVAMRELLLATLTLLESHGLAPGDPALTHREIVGALRPRPRLAEALRPVVDAYEPVWYGRQSLSKEAFEAFRGRIEDAQRLSRQDDGPPRPEVLQ
jgi:hypothetical protein